MWYYVYLHWWFVIYVHGSEDVVSTMTEWDIPCAEQRKTTDLGGSGSLGDLQWRREGVEIVEGRGGPSRRKHERSNMLTTINRWKIFSQLPMVCENPFPHTIFPFPKNNREQATPMVWGGQQSLTGKRKKNSSQSETGGDTGQPLWPPPATIPYSIKISRGERSPPTTEPSMVPLVGGQTGMAQGPGRSLPHSGRTVQQVKYIVWGSNNSLNLFSRALRLTCCFKIHRTNDHVLHIRRCLYVWQQVKKKTE